MMTVPKKTELVLLLRQVPGLGETNIRRLLNYYSSFDELKSVSARHLEAIDGIGPKRAAETASFRFDRDVLEKELRFLEKNEIDLLTPWTDNYPEVLKPLDGMPLILYWMGNRKVLEEPGLAIVGTRQPTSYGQRAAEYFSRDLVRAGLTIVSGFARGIDTAAHLGALAEGGRTIAVLGSGFNYLYPAENKPLVPRILESGGLLTEYPPFTRPDPAFFPERNRLISGLSLGTLVVEAAETGGALITAAYALDQNKEVFAVPGEIFQDRSKGTNRLILNGQAKLVLSAGDILSELRGFSSRQPEPRVLPELSLFEEKIYGILSQEPLHIDVLGDASEMSSAELMIHLLSLEFKGAIRQLPGKYFIRME